MGSQRVNEFWVTKLKMKQENQFGAGFIVKRRIMNLFGQGLVGIALLMGGMVCAQQRVDVQIPLHDPVKPDEPAIDFRVELILDADGFPLEYRLPLFTGVCLAKTIRPRTRQRRPNSKRGCFTSRWMTRPRGLSISSMWSTSIRAPAKPIWRESDCGRSASPFGSRS